MSKMIIDTRDRQHPLDGGRVVFMARSGGYVMCKRPRCMPFILTEKEWGKLLRYVKPASEGEQE